MHIAIAVIVLLLGLAGGLIYNRINDYEVLLGIVKKEELNIPEYIIKSQNKRELMNEVEKLKKERQLTIDTNINVINSNYSILKKYIDITIPSLDNSNTSETLKKQNIKLLAYDSYFKDLITKNKSNNVFFNPLWQTNSESRNTLINSMSTEDLVGQLLITGISGQLFSELDNNQLKAFSPGGIILMSPNIKDQDQFKNLNNTIQLTNNKIPMFITTDQEGGVVKRINWDNTSPQLDWLNMNQLELCKQAKDRSNILNELGINLNLAPVADLKNNSDAFINTRTISNDPLKTSTIINQYLNCFRTKSMSTLKHFPSHGMVTGDSHKIIPVNNNIDYNTWNNTHALPFKNNLDSDFIMSGHIVINQIDSKPASMSKRWITEELLTKLEYKGLVITDDMEQFYNISGEDRLTSAINALEAGNDMLLYVPSVDNIETVKKGLIEYYSTRKAVLKQKVSKILMVKSKI